MTRPATLADVCPGATIGVGEALFVVASVSVAPNEWMLDVLVAGHTGGLLKGVGRVEVGERVRLFGTDEQMAQSLSVLEWHGAEGRRVAVPVELARRLGVRQVGGRGLGEGAMTLKPGDGVSKPRLRGDACRRG